MKQFMTAKTFGMPRYAWIALLAGGVVLGLYLRSRSAPVAEADQEPIYTSQDTLYDNAYDGGLAGVGVVGPPGGSVVPVQTPYLPEGVVDIIGGLGITIGDLAAGIVDLSVSRQLDPGISATEPITGGGPPSVPDAAHTPPGKCSPGDRVRIASLTARLQTINARLKVINDRIREIRAQKNYAKNPTAQQRAQTLANERAALQREREILQRQREPIQARCR